MTRITTFQDPPDLPPPNFDPVNIPSDAKKLEKFWLPPMPDARMQPELYAHWREMLSPPLHFVPACTKAVNISKPWATTLLLDMAGPDADHPHGAPAGLPVGPGPLCSANWSGAFLQASGNSSFTRVAAAWKVPSVNAGARSALEPGDVPFRCSAWIGIDGRGGTDSMPQLGSVHMVTAQGGQRHGLWWQWWRRGYSAPDGLPHDVTGVPVDIGDRVMCSLTAISPTTMRMHFVNRTKGLFATLQVEGAAPIEGSTVEWILERPADFTRAETPTDPGPLHPLPDFGSVTMDNCAADFGTRPVPTWSPELIEMVQHFSHPDRIPVVSQPSNVGEGNTVRFTYLPP